MIQGVEISLMVNQRRLIRSQDKCAPVFIKLDENFKLFHSSLIIRRDKRFYHNSYPSEYYFIANYQVQMRFEIFGES